MSFDLLPRRERIGTVSARLQTLPAALAAVASGLGLRVPSDLAGAQATSNLAKAADFLRSAELMSGTSGRLRR